MQIFSGNIMRKILKQTKTKNEIENEITAKIIEDFTVENLKKLKFPILSLNPFVPPSFEILWDELDLL